MCWTTFKFTDSLPYACVFLLIKVYVLQIYYCLYAGSHYQSVSTSQSIPCTSACSEARVHIFSLLSSSSIWVMASFRECYKSPTFLHLIRRVRWQLHLCLETGRLPGSIAYQENSAQDYIVSFRLLLNSSQNMAISH